MVNSSQNMIAIAAFPKSGVTFLDMLLFGALFPGTTAADFGRHCVVDTHAFNINDARETCGHRFYKTHSPFGRRPHLDAQTNRAIYIIRDPIDIAFSAYDFLALLDPDHQISRDAFLNQWLESGGAWFDFAGPWKDHVNSWLDQKAIPVLLVNYSELVQRTEAEALRVFDFIGISPSKAAAANALEISPMKAMRKREDAEFETKEEAAFYKPSLEKGMQKGARFINRGYRNSYALLSDAQKRLADAQFGEFLGITS
jgi:Sulfotransferase domain